MARISRLYDNATEAYEAAQALKEANVPERDISLLSANGVDGETSNPAVTGAEAGAAIGGGAGLLAGLGAIAIPGLGPFVAAGWLTATLAGAVAGGVTGAAAGSLLDTLIDEADIEENEAHVYAETLQRGGAMLVARCEDHRAAEIEAVLDRRRSVHPPARAEAYESEGWRGYDDSRAYSPEAMRDRLLAKDPIPRV